ncbi:amino acid adenylation domain-containing protein [Lacrimispora xylanisolvens]|uniref:Amino acid adenylation domain-containing protein n=2 Tax=Lacrimispora xylanisolvens TaxID=384636 RepID=A0A2S6HNE0_9FIRM|nr:amino acid adenylation domain-containing protein [Hungatella xylanolytica]PPK78969.1 amino acid adenylation domain-containing protein [Hungatella xylanolytica]
MNNILEYLEHSAKEFPQKKAVIDPETSCTYEELYDRAKRIGSFLSEHTKTGKPVVVFMDKCVEAVTSFMGIVYAGCFYTFISPDQPAARISQILDVLKTDCMISLSETDEKLKQISFKGTILDYHKLISAPADPERLKAVREKSLDTQPLYCNFTSGSTGVPKGVLVSHRSVIDFMEYFPDLFGITTDDILGNQAPLDFDVSVKDLYSAFKTGASIVLIPKKYFSIPTMLLDCLCEYQITTLIWAVSALCMVTQLKGFTYKVPEHVNKVLFSGEAMPASHLAIWQKNLPDARFVNLYGPTEITCNCTYYPVLRVFEPEEKIPIGTSFPNEHVFLLGSDDELITSEGEIGEICVAGTALALGYYNNPEQTKKAFVQNPLNDLYPETIYRTGDLAFYNSHGELCFSGRKDFQIKHMGHRIELEEIELILNSYPEISRACCAFDSEKNRLAAFYCGDLDKKELLKRMRETLPSYMIPSLCIPVLHIPVTANGKMDRKKLLEMCL